MDTYVHDAFIELGGVKVWPPSTAVLATVTAIVLAVGVIISTITWWTRNR